MDITLAQEVKTPQAVYLQPLSQLITHPNRNI